jgi:hypothetical protein
MTIEHDLHRLGDALEQAAAADLDHPPATRPVAAARRLRSRRLLVGLVAAAVAIPAVAYGATRIFGTEQVAASMPAGTLALAGTDPTCTVVREGVEFHCVLARAPAPEVADWTGTVEPTVNGAKKVNGGCRGLNGAGTEWECYLGQAAVDQQIIGQDLLGQTVEGPGVG